MVPQYGGNGFEASTNWLNATTARPVPGVGSEKLCTAFFPGNCRISPFNSSSKRAAKISQRAFRSLELDPLIDGSRILGLAQPGARFSWVEVSSSGNRDAVSGSGDSYGPEPSASRMLSVGGCCHGFFKICDEPSTLFNQRVRTPRILLRPVPGTG